jgi:hypothetical protein
MNTAIALLRKNENQEMIIFLKSWNEWAEGNHLEPDLEFGDAYLSAIRQTIGHVEPS